VKRTWLWTAVTITVLALASYVVYLVLIPPPLPPGLLYGNGHIEGTEVVVSAETGGTVVENDVVEGNPVHEGELLVKLDDTELRIKLTQAEAQLAAVQRSQDALREQLGLWRHHLSSAQSDLKRFRELRQRGSISPQQLTQAEDRFREAQSRVKALEAQIAEAGDRQTAAGQSVALLKRQLEKTEIRAPIAGTVQTKAIEAGELAEPGRSVAVLVDLSRLELKVYIPEKDIGKVTLGAAARVRVDAFPERYFDASVMRVDQKAQFTPRDVHLPEERVRMVFGVTLALKNPQGWLKPGMPADAWIRWQNNAKWPARLTVPR